MVKLGLFFAYLTSFMVMLQLSRVVLRLTITRLNKANKKPDPKGNLMKFNRFILKNHRNFGIAAVSFAFIHFIIMWSNLWLSVTGLITITLLSLTASLGYLSTKSKNKKIKLAHRGMTIILLLAMSLHYFTNAL